MYDFLSGRLAVRKPSYVVIEAGGVGYRVEIPLSTFEKLPRDGEVRLFTWLKVSADDLRLYGFATEREREIFLRLVEGVQQLGPAKALAILSAASPEELIRAVEQGDVAFLKGIRGVGDKIANRLVVELRGRLPAAPGEESAESSLMRDAVAALVGLGYDRRQAEEAVRRAHKELGGPVGVEDLIKRSLAHV